MNLPRAVEWYFDRLYWAGEKNVVLGLLNLGMDGGTLSGSTAPLGWTALAGGAIAQVGTMPAYVVTGPGTGELTQIAAATSLGVSILQPNLRHAIRFWMLGTGSKVGQFVATIFSPLTGFTATALFNLSGLTQSGYVTVSFSQAMPSTIPADMTLSVKFTSLTGAATIRDLQLIYADNPDRNPIARTSYLKNPEAYDALTGNIGPNDDNSELRAMFVLQESLYFLTARRLYATQQIGNSEPSAWDVIQIADKCGAFSANSVATGKGWATWGGPLGAFWFGGGLPDKTSAIIAPTWRNVVSMTRIFNDSDAERVYMGVVDASGNKSMLVYDYHEVGSGGAGKWTPWNRPSGWVGNSATGVVFVFANKFYRLDTSVGVLDDDFGAIGGYYTFAALAVSMFQKSYQYMGLRIAGLGVLTPFLYAANLGALTQTLAGQDLSKLVDTVAEWPMNIRGRLLFMKLGQPNVQFDLEGATAVYQNEPNGSISGVR